MHEPFQFNQSLLAPIKEGAERLEQDILELETRIHHDGVFRAMLEHPEWKPILESIRTLGTRAQDALLTKEVGAYTQGRYHGILYVIRLLTKPPFESEQERQELSKALPALREKLATHRKLLGKAPST